MTRLFNGGGVVELKMVKEAVERREDSLAGSWAMRKEK
jgi:hypothetical protein